MEHPDQKRSSTDTIGIEITVRANINVRQEKKTKRNTCTTSALIITS